MPDIGFGTFDPEAAAPDDYVLLMRLDCVIDPGLSVDLFKELFVQCLACQTCLTRRNIAYHNCNNVRDMCQKAFTEDRDREQLLHRYGGLPVERFEALFIHCATCDKFMTRSACYGHRCDSGLWEELFGTE